MFSNGGRYTIITDAAGGYLRKKDNNIGKNGAYVTTEGKYQKDFVSKKDFLKHSHYRILKREEM